MLTADSRLTDAELLQYCHDPNIPERERLILARKNTTPGDAELLRAQAIAKEQRAQAQQATFPERKDPQRSDSALGRTKTNKLEGFFGERPTSFQRPSPGSSPNLSTSPRDQARPNTKRLRNFFGQRPPSELISSNLAEYFPDHEKNVLEETVRNSIRRSTRMSHAGGRRFSTATTASSVSSRDKEIPPLPTMSDAFRDSSGSGTLTPPKLNVPPGIRSRPLSLRRSTSGYRNSIVESLLEEDSDDGDAKEWSVVEGDTLRPSSDFTTVTSLTETGPTEKEEKPEQEEEEEEEEYDSEDEDVKGEFDAVGGGPTRWIRGALIGAGSFGSVYLGMNRASGELMAVKQVELPSHDVQGEQRKHSMLLALQREIALLRDLTHENIVHYIGMWTEV